MEAALETALGAIGRFIEFQGVAVFLSIMYAGLTWKALGYMRESLRYMRERDLAFEENQKRDNDQIDRHLDILATTVVTIEVIKDSNERIQTAVIENTASVNTMQQTLETLVEGSVE